MDFVTNLIRCTAGQQFLFINTPVKGESISKPTFQRLGIHPFGLGLNRIQYVQAHFYEILYHRHNGAARVIERLETHIFERTNELLAVWFDVLTPQLW